MRCFVLLAAVLIVWADTSMAETYTVWPDGTGDFPTIQAGIDDCSDGDIIELADGTFGGSGNRDIDYGGKAITVRSAGGNHETCVIDCGGAPESLHRGVVFSSGESWDSVLEGVTITGGFADYGGGIYCDGSAPAIRDVKLSLNIADEAGGGMYCYYASPVLENVTFWRNRTPGPVPYHCGRGGGMYCVGGAPILTDVLFHGNSASSTEPYCYGNAGGMRCGDATLTRVVFHGNSADGSCGGLNCDSATLTDCRFTWNSTGIGDGGGMCSFGSSTLINVVFEDNTAFVGSAGSRPHSGYGGGLVCGDGTLIHVTFSNNGAYFAGGGMMCGGSPTIINSTFFGNSVVEDGGGACFATGSPTITNCTFVGNYSENEEPYGGGGGVFCEGASVTLENTIIAFGMGGGAVSCSDGGSAALTCCDIFANEGGDWVGCIADQYGVDGNIAMAPLFCFDEHPESPYTLRGNSPCAPHSAPNPECGLIGAWPIGCGPSAVERATWGTIKAMFR